MPSPASRKIQHAVQCPLRLALGVGLCSVLSLGMLPLYPQGSTAALQLAQSPSIEPRRVEADRLLDLGIDQFNSSNFPAALESWQQALRLYQALNDYGGVSKALNNLGSASYTLGNYEDAIKYQQQSLAIARQLQNRWGEGAALNNLGLAFYALGDYATAIDYQQQSLNIKREINDRPGEGTSLNNLGLAYYRLGNYSRAIDYQQQSLAIRLEVKDRRGEMGTLNNLGIAHFALGDYRVGIEYLKQSLAIARELKDRWSEGNVLGDLGAFYYELGDYPKAIEYQQQRLAIAREIKDRPGEGNALGNLGLAYRSLQDYAKAINYHKQSLAIKQQIKDRQGEGTTLNNLGLVYSVMGDYAKAMNYQQQSLAIAREIKDYRAEGTVLGNLGIVYYELGDYPKAVQYYKQSLVIKQQIKDRPGEGISLNNLGNALFKLGQLAEAKVYLLKSIQVYELLRQGLQDSQKVSITDTQQDPYKNLQRVLIAQKQVESALEIAERGRARAFVELLAQRTQGNTPLTIQPIQIAAIKQVAREQNATLVEYSNIYNEQLFIWVVKPTGEVIFRKTDLKPFIRQNQTLQDLVVTSRQSIGVANRSPVFQETIAYTTPDRQEHPELKQLYQLLIQPIQDLLPQDPQQRVIFIPQDSLFFVPFAALQSPSGQYLLERHTIVTAPAIQVLEMTRRQRQRLATSTNHQTVVVGNPTMPKVALKVGETTQTLPSLPGAEQEAQKIAELLKTTPLIGKQATEATVVKLMSQSRIIHLATHGLLDEVKGLGIPGAIALAPTPTDSGLLTSEELLKLTLQAELVVLSACNTGQGQVTGDGVIGLSRSLITAGVPSVIVSLWAVPDAPTAELMTRFYQNLQQGQDKAQALRQAMLETQKDFPDPRAWAAFTLIGEAD